MTVRTVPNYLRVRIRYGAAIAMLLLAWLLASLPMVKDFERTLYDWRVRLAVSNDEPLDDIVIVGIDDESLDRLEPVVQRWPWPRFIHGIILNYCDSAKVVAVDVLFPEHQWPMWPSDPGDQALIDDARKNGEVYLAAQFIDEGLSDSPEPPGLGALAMLKDEGLDDGDILSFNGALVPFSELLAAVKGVGHVNVDRDSDGTLRNFQAVVDYRGKIYPSLSLVAAARYLDVDPAAVRLDAEGVLHLGDHRMPLDPRGRFLLSPMPKDYPTYRVADLVDSLNAENAGLAPLVPRSAFDDKIVLLGIMATGVRDHEITSLSGAAPGVLINATAVQNLLQQTAFRRTSNWVQYVLMILLALLPAVPRLERPRALLALGFGLLLVYVAVALGFAYGARLIAPLVGPLLANGLSCAALQGMYWGQERARRKYFETLEVAKQQFTDMLVHDLKNTVAPIVMSLALVDDRADLEEELSPEDIRFWRKDFPEIVATSSSKLMTQINALLDIRRMQEGRLQLHRAPHDPNQLIQKVAEQYQVAAERTDLRIEVTERVEEGPRVYVDAEVFDRILGNLVWNAVKFAKQDTAIEIGSRLIGADTMEFFVANHGRPIPVEAQEHLFMAFVSGRELEKERKAMPSTGLGLTFCKLAAEAHGGKILLKSPMAKGGDGVVVTLRFPRAREDTPSGS